MISKIKHVAKKCIQQGMISSAEYYLFKKKRIEETRRIIECYHTTVKTGLEEEQKIDDSFEPLISIITPLYNTPEAFLRELLESVINQTYLNWELCLADGSDEAHAYVEQVCIEASDERIRYVRLEKNEGIVGNTNCCVSFAKGDYYCLLDHDDILHPSALLECVKAIEKGADFVYTDEMKFSGDVRDSVDIICKNDFSKFELRSHNYLCHLVMFKADLLEGMDELYRSKCEGSQDYDMVLRLTEKAEKIVHIPKILYYWRVHEGSVAMNLEVKHYAVDAAKIAIRDHLERMNINGKVECNYPYETIYRLQYEVEKKELITIVWNGNINKKKDLHSLKKLLENTSYQPLEVICKGDYPRVMQKPGVTLRIVAETGENETEWQWFNQAAYLAQGYAIVFMDKGLKPITDSWVQELYMLANQPDVGMVSPLMKDKLERIVYAGAMLDTMSESGVYKLNYKLDAKEQGYEANMRHVRSVAIVPYVCMMIKKDLFETMNGFDESMEHMCDADLSLRIKEQGFENIWTPFAEIRAEKILSLWENSKDSFSEKWITEDKVLEGGYYCHPLLKEINYI